MVIAGLETQVAGRIRKVDARWRVSFLALLVFALVFQAGCAVRPPRDVVGWRSVDGIDPSSAKSFRLSGRLAVSDGKDGGSAGFLWTQRADRFEFELRQPVSQRTWRLYGVDGGARLDGSATLEGGDDGPRHGESAEALLAEVLGWRVPAAALRYWVRGLTHPWLRGVPFHGPPTRMVHDEDGRLTGFTQDGWEVEYRAWQEDGAWPTRIVARRPPYSVRLTIRDWAVGDD